MIIGICGKSGSGKSSLANEIISNYNGAVHLDIDTVGHNVLTFNEVKEELVNAFGTSIINNNVIDRKKLSRIVFNSKSEMAKLTDITWKHMQIEIDKFINLYKDRIVILDWILLPNSKYFDMCDIKILLDISYEERLKRAMKRDNITEEAFILREKASIDYDKNSFDFVLNENDNEIVKRIVKIL